MTNLPPLPQPRPMPVAVRQATRVLLEATSTPPDATPGRRWLSRGVVIGAVAGLVVTGGAATAYVAFAPAPDQLTVRCFTLPELGTEDDYHAADAALLAPDPVGSVPITDPVSLCADMWRQGVIAYGDKTARALDQSDLAAADYAVPELTACVLDTGIAGVFPAGPDICSRLGLPTLQTDTPIG